MPLNTMKLTPLNQAIIKTLAYSDIFDFPLTRAEVHQYLISSVSTPKHLVDLSLNQLCTRHYISSNLTWVGKSQVELFSLQGREKTFINRSRRHSITEKKTKIGEAIGKWLIKLPTVQAVYLTGTVSINNAQPNDDIDLMIVTINHALWLTRLITTLALEITQKRRKPEVKVHRNRVVRDKICSNLFLTPTSLSVPSFKQSLYTAHEVVQARPLFFKHHTHLQFLWHNRWVYNFLPNTPLPPSSPYPLQTSPLSTILLPVDLLTYYLQQWYMKSRRTTELITPNSAYFHPRDTAKNVLKQYNHKLQKLGITT